MLSATFLQLFVTEFVIKYTYYKNALDDVDHDSQPIVKNCILVTNIYYVSRQIENSNIK